MKSRKIYLLLALSTFLIVPFAKAHNALIRVTEAVSNSGGVISDWFEITNYGTETVDITGWKMDDNTFNIGLSVPLLGETTIQPGKSVVFLEVEDLTHETEISLFKQFWGANANDLAVGYYFGTDVSLSSKGDAIILYDELGEEVTRATFGASDPGLSFYWSYDLEGGLVTAGVSEVGTITGTNSNQFTYVSENNLGNIASPGTAVVYAIRNGTDDNNYMGTKVFPNPFTNNINLQTEESVSGICLKNLAGQSMMDFPQETSNQLDTSSLPGGIYFLTVTWANGDRKEFKLVKK
ncbi:MAG TPA: lamin tail domain-containing protein [Paludibacter sp.]|nr:lamin tail domain-containing protein [Paludibacter sp.]